MKTSFHLFFCFCLLFMPVLKRIYIYQLKKISEQFVNTQNNFYCKGFNVPGGDCSFYNIQGSDTVQTRSWVPTHRKSMLPRTPRCKLILILSSYMGNQYTRISGCFRGGTCSDCGLLVSDTVRLVDGCQYFGEIWRLYLPNRSGSLL